MKILKDSRKEWWLSDFMKKEIEPQAQALLNIQAAISRLEAWQEGERKAQILAEGRLDGHEGHYHTQRNYQGLIDTLKNALDDLT